MDWILEQFGADRVQARKEYRLFVTAGLDSASPWNDLKGQCLLGDEAFLEKLYPLLKDKSALKEIPRVQRFADRPALEEILQGTEDRAQRDAAILKASHEYGYTQAQIAAATGLHYSTVSKIIGKKHNSRFKI